MKKLKGVYACNKCLNVEVVEREGACWECGNGEMIYRVINYWNKKPKKECKTMLVSWIYKPKKCKARAIVGDYCRRHAKMVKNKDTI